MEWEIGLISSLHNAQMELVFDLIMKGRRLTCESIRFRMKIAMLVIFSFCKFQL